MTNKDLWGKFLEKIKASLQAFYNNNLVAAVIFGSAARGDLHKSSDLDILIILRDSQDFLGKRIDKFMQIIAQIRKMEEYLAAKENGLPHRLEPVILSKEEFQNHPPLLLDLTSDALPPIDEEKFFALEMDLLLQRLNELGAKKVILNNGRWDWVIKPNIKWREEISL